MQTPPLVSIVIPTYNHAQFLGEAVESAQAQTGSSIEIIVVDDGSKDDPAAVVSRYPGVRLIRQGNAGLAAARNTGWRHAAGRFLVFLDADDRLAPGALEANLLTIQAHQACAFVYGRYRFIGADGTPLKTASFVEIGPDPFASFLRANTVGMHATVMYRRQILMEVGGFDPTLRACEDYDLFLRLSRRHPVACTPALVAEYRMHAGNMSRDIPFMLDWALAVLRRQESAAAGDPAHWSAYLEGLRSWKRHYAAQQLGRIWRQPGPESLRDLARVAYRAPLVLARTAGGALARRLALD